MKQDSTMPEDIPVVKMNLERIDAATVVDREPLLARSSLVQALGMARGEVLAGAGMRRYPHGATVYVNGSTADRVFLVARGEVAILSSHGADATPLATLQVGDCFGAGAALDPPVRSVTVRAVTVADLVEIPVASLRKVVAMAPSFGTFLRETHERLAGAKTELDDFLGRW